MNELSQYRQDFPILNTKIKGHDLVYFDNAATTQKPNQVINAINEYYTHENSNIHRGAHHLAHLATEKYELVRQKIADFLNGSIEEVLFTSGTTMSINLLATSWGQKFLKKGDKVLLTEMEHHANIVPWLHLKETIGIEVIYIPMKEDATLDISKLDDLLDDKVKLVSIAYVSNAMGTVHPIEEIIKKAKLLNCLVHIDAAQAIQHIPINVKSMNIDFLSFSGHKIYGPMGTGVFWGKKELLNYMNPFLYGGEMIYEVTLDHATYNELPFKFEAGTPNVAGIVGLGISIDYINNIGLDTIEKAEKELHSYFLEKIKEMENVIVYTPENSVSCVSFNVKDVHPFDVGQLLDTMGIAIRTGHHCCQPMMRKLGLEGTCRASLALYNTREEVDYFIESLEKCIKILS